MINTPVLMIWIRLLLSLLVAGLLIAWVVTGRRKQFLLRLTGVCLLLLSVMMILQAGR